MDQESKERLKKNIALVCLGAAFIVVTGFAIIKLGVLQHMSAERLEDRYAQEIATYTSEHDEDGDGIDDQTDILQNALAYIQTQSAQSEGLFC